MKTGISTATLFQRLYNEDAVALLSEWDIETSEVFFTSFSEYEPRFSEMLLSKKGALPVNSVHVLNTQFEPQLFSGHPRVRSDAYMWLGKAMTSAQLLNAAYYSFHGLARIKRTFREDVAATGKKLGEISDFCKNYGVTLCLENVEWAFYNRPGLFGELKKYCSSLKGVLDIKQARISGYAYEEYLKDMGGDITHVHVSDYTSSGKMCLPGRGIFDFDTLLKRLKDVGFQGAVIIENYGGDYGEYAELKQAYEFLSEKIQKYR